MMTLLKNMFEGKPEKSTITLKGNCSDCGCDTTIDITSTSVGFGLQGGILFKCSPDEFLMRCPDCGQKKQKTKDH